MIKANKCRALVHVGVAFKERIANYIRLFCWNIPNAFTLLSEIILPSFVVFHHDLTSPIQYVLSVPELINQLVIWLLSDGRPMSVKTANDPPRDKQSLLALYLSLIHI